MYSHRDLWAPLSQKNSRFLQLVRSGLLKKKLKNNYEKCGFYILKYKIHTLNFEKYLFGGGRGAYLDFERYLFGFKTSASTFL